MLGDDKCCREAGRCGFKGNKQQSRSGERYCEDDRERRNGDRGRHHHHDSERLRANLRRDRIDSRRPYRDRSCERRRGDRSARYSQQVNLQKEQHHSMDRRFSPTASSTKCGWDEMAEEFEKQTSIIQEELNRYKRKFHRSDSVGSSKQQNNSNADDIACETDQVTLMRRQKQIDYGKNTLAYDNYSLKVPRHARTKDDPCTPTKFAVCSRRAWDGRIKEWRKKLHHWDTGAKKGQEEDCVPAEGVLEAEACLDNVPDLELLDPMDIDKEQASNI